MESRTQAEAAERQWVLELLESLDRPVDNQPATHSDVQYFINNMRE